jgi:hypothetical protein
MNVAKTADAFLKELEDAGYFNEIVIEDVERSGYWHQEYAMFYIHFDTFAPYFDSSRFEYDFLKTLKKRFPDCKVNSRFHIDEFEIIGPNYDEFVAVHEDAIEKMATESDEPFLIYEPMENV